MATVGMLASRITGANPGGSVNLFGVDRSSKTYAGDTYSALTRQQWQDYVSTFVPIENQLIQYATDPNKVSDAMADASRNVNESFDAAQASSQRRLRGLGVTLSADEQRASQRSGALARSLADVQAQGLARALTERRQQQVLGNPAPQAAATGAFGGGGS